MSCWVVPTVAGEFWGVTLDVVWRRISDGQIPYKVDGGFVFVDVDPWAADSNGVMQHTPPATFVSTADQSPLVRPGELTRFGAFEDIPPQVQDEPQETPEGILPPLDEEETATFGRLSWVDVRQRVGSTRRPPGSPRN